MGVAFLALLGQFLFSGCAKQQDITEEEKTIQELAKEHSSALDFFYKTALSNGYIFDVDGVKSTSNAGNVINGQMIANILSEYNFSSSSSIRIPIIQTKSEDFISEDYANALDIFLGRIVTDESFSSFDSFSEFVLSSMEDIEKIDILNEYHEFTELALYILIDSYDYWINQEKFAEWVTTICSSELQYQIALKIGHPELVNATKVSGAGMRAWAEVCKTNDEATNGLLSDAIRSDSFGLAGSAAGGLLFGGLGVASCLFGAGWSSIGTLLGI